MNEGWYHFYKGKKTKKSESSQLNNETKLFLDKFIYFIGIYGPIMTIPQILKIYVDKNASGVSVISWSSYAFCAIFWIIYGIIHKEKPIVLTYCVWLALDIVIVIGTFIYG